MSDSGPFHNISNCIKALQDTPFKLSYLAEGNANVIYTFKPTNSQLTPHSNCCVLRLRKDLPFTKPAIEVLSEFQTRILTLYGDHEDLLLDQALYTLDNTTLQQAQSILKDLEREQKPNRPENRRGIYLPSLVREPHGIIMPNLRRGTSSPLLEFKPKWLIQSPSAPAHAVRCRTCTLNAMRREQGKAPGRGDSGFCPLKLLSKDNTTLTELLRNLDPITSKESFIRDFLSKVQPALLLHRKLQEQHNQVGLSDFLNPVGKDFSLAMALRDCSMFLVVDIIDPDRPRIMDVKFADLDLKTTDGGKLQHWASIEQFLIDSGSYLTPDSVCALSP